MDTQSFSANPVIEKATNTSVVTRILRQLHTSNRLILMLYPLTLLLGQLYQFGPNEPTYFASKRNIINVLFVKRGWLWTAIAYFILLAYRLSLPASSLVATKPRYRLSRMIARFLVATLYWVVFTQWFFGLPIMDRVFVFTGGKCNGGVQIQDSLVNVSSATCRSVGGTWLGGHDPSGHTFLLIHSSLFLWYELSPFLDEFLTIYRAGRNDSKSRKSILVALPTHLKLIIALLILWWWMFLMTCIYFHSFFEKISGLIWAYVEVVLVYMIFRHLL
ncbi:hypothetical protein NADFUDRAFT_67312 [Nadsonia fulvescens var. elongata DSM 6958]|uniref:Acyl-coenzyme A diphosphatase SCS3 n=1 Tax=Nadsonia fulvescens var. elongata DSM 6958 TaxID=857566 RepID=A0A1E3PEW6_9ASCO|nr:hypothetical protein NADFUDRAFT_67312 [Nadsonia fulvescens var. elongata DSM 6958]